MPKANQTRPPTVPKPDFKPVLKPDTQTSLRMPTDLRERLQAAADANRRGIGHEIVDRLETSFTTPRQSDANTGELLTVIAVMAKTLADNWVAWHADADAHAVFRDAVAAVLAELAPDTTGAVKTRQAEVLFGGDGAGERLALMTLYRAS